MKLYSTNGSKKAVSFREAIQNGIAEDGGLYIPYEIPKFPESFFSKISTLPFQEIALEVANLLLKDEIPSDQIEKIIRQAITFDAPVRKLAPGLNILELFHGPTLAFKDFGARFMAKTLSYFLKNENRELTILVATSGDTGSAVANGFFNTEGIRVIILYPSGKVSEIQEKQLTTLGGNITALEIDGTFDDCQRLVKQAFADEELNKRQWFSSANSINIGRLLPQSFYYFNAFARTEEKDLPFIVSVPSGNFGNLTAGIMASIMGLPVNKFIAATNINDIVPKYLETGIFTPKPSIQTISNAMDVGNPSNFARIKEIFKNDYNSIKNRIFGFSFSDDETRGAIKEIQEKFDYLIDPHGAVGYLALKKFANDNFNYYNSVILETAHPAKFINIVEEVTGRKIEIPDLLKGCLQKQKQSVKLSKEYGDLRSYLFTF
ncbi:MAG: threonine synthase [Bacteroidota bacterium]|nr:threonine synthase [Bacteroidota bacterium]MDP4194740.1 threonine synthase [Bacteroidota bacterium]